MDFRNLLGTLNQLNEDVEVVSEKAASQAQQKAAGAALSAKRGDTPKSELTGASKEMLDMSEKDLEDFAGTKHKGIPKKKTDENYEDLNSIRKLSGLEEADEQDIMDKLQQMADGPDGEDELLMKMNMGIGEEGMFLRKLYNKVSNQMFSMDSGDLEDPEDFDKVHAEVMQMFGIEAEPLASLQQKAKDREISSALSDPELTGMEPRETVSNEFDSSAFREAFEAMVEAKGKMPDFPDVDGDGNKKEPIEQAQKDAKDDDDNDKSDDKGLTDKQKKLPKGLQKAIAKKNKSVEEGKSKHPKGSAKYKKQMAAKHASMNEELAEDDMEMDIDANMDVPVDPDQEMTASPEQAIDQADEIDMAMGQLEFIKYAAEEIKGHFKMGFEMEEWFQNKLARMHGTMMTLHAYIEGEEGKAGMNESINENDMFNQMPQGMKDKILQMYTKKLGGDKNKAMELLQMVLSPEGQKKIKSPQGQRIIGATPQQMKDPKNQALMQKAKKMDQFQTSMGESINESFEKFMNNDKLSFEEAMKIVRESGGQQKIDPVDTKLWNWAKRVASNKFTESSKAELYAGVIYERNGGVFELTDVLNESK